MGRLFPAPWVLVAGAAVALPLHIFLTARGF